MTISDVLKNLSGSEKDFSVILYIYNRWMQVMIEDIVKTLIFGKIRFLQKSRFSTKIYTSEWLKIENIKNHILSIISWQICLRRSCENLKSISLIALKKCFSPTLKTLFRKNEFKFWEPFTLTFFILTNTIITPTLFVGSN